MKIHTMPQRSPEWYGIRRGIPTASVADKIITPKTGKLSGQADGLINVLLAERAGFEIDEIDGKWLEHGREMEGEATKFFEFETGHRVEAVGFITNDEGTAGCSPDGMVYLVPHDGNTYTVGPHNVIGYEGKAPAPHTHFGYLREGGLPDKYRPQVHASMAITGLDRWYFCSYVRGLDPVLVLVERDEFTEKVAAAYAQFIERLENEALRFGLGLEEWRAAA